MNSDVVIRWFEIEDQSAVADLLHAGLRQRFGESYDPRFNLDIDNIEVFHLAAGTTVIVAEAIGKIIGCGMLIREGDSDNIGRLVRVSVRAGQQGRGLGRRISERLIALGREQGFKQLLVETNSDWHSALHLYKSCGFTEYARTVDTQFGLTEVHMRLDLRESESTK